MFHGEHFYLKCSLCEKTGVKVVKLHIFRAINLKYRLLWSWESTSRSLCRTQGKQGCARLIVGVLFYRFGCLEANLGVFGAFLLLLGTFFLCLAGFKRFLCVFGTLPCISQFIARFKHFARIARTEVLLYYRRFAGDPRGFVARYQGLITPYWAFLAIFFAFIRPKNHNLIVLNLLVCQDVLSAQPGTARSFIPSSHP